MAKCGGFQWKYKNSDKKILIVPDKSRKIVYQYDKQMNLIAIFTSAIDAEKKHWCKNK